MLSKAVIITRTKNRPNFLRRAMLSALGKSYDDRAHVIVNDGGQRNEIDLLALEFEEDGQANKKPHNQMHKHPQPLRLDRANWLEQGELVCDAAPERDHGGLPSLNTPSGM